MQKPLLLLCWAATIVSASSLKNVNDTIIESNAAATPLLSDSTETKLNKDNQSIHDPVEISNIDPTTESTSNLTTTVSTTTKPTTTTTKPTTTTTKPTTTTTKPTTTTTKPTTTTTNPTTTTSTPSTTVTPAPMPTMPPPPEAGKWKVQENNTVCILVQMAAQLNISYFNSDNKTVFKIVNIPSNGTVTGNCSKIDQYLMLSWHVQNKTAENNFTIHFIKNETEKYYSLHHFEISLTPEEFPNDKFNNSMTLVHMTPQFQTELSNSYRCIKEQKLNVTQKGKNITVGYLKVSKLLFQAFRSDNTTIFGLAKDCSFDTPDIVPITVGCALAGLVVIVLIAYLVGRRRNQAHGYFSM